MNLKNSISFGLFLTFAICFCADFSLGQEKELERLKKLNGDLLKVKVQIDQLAQIQQATQASFDAAKESGDAATQHRAAAKLAAARTQLKTHQAAAAQLEAMIASAEKRLHQNQQELLRQEMNQRELMREREMRARRGARFDGFRPSNDRNTRSDLESRMAHAQRAMEHLREAGLNDLARRTGQELESMRVELARQNGDRRGDRFDDRNRTRDPFSDDRARDQSNARDREMLNAIRELNQAVLQLRKEVNELKKK